MHVEIIYYVYISDDNSWWTGQRGVYSGDIRDAEKFEVINDAESVARDYDGIVLWQVKPT